MTETENLPHALLDAYLDTSVEDDIFDAVPACERMSRFFSPVQVDPINRAPLVAGIIDMNANDIGHIANGHPGSLRGMHVERDGRILITAVLVDEAGSPPVHENGFWLLKTYTTKKGNKRYSGIRFTGEQVFTEGMHDVLIPTLDAGIGVYLTSTEWQEEAARPPSGRSTRPFGWTQALCSDVYQASRVLKPYKSPTPTEDRKTKQTNAPPMRDETMTNETPNLKTLNKAALVALCVENELVSMGTKVVLMDRLNRHVYDKQGTTSAAPTVDPRVQQVTDLQAQVDALVASMNGNAAPVAAAPVTAAPVGGAAQFALKQNGKARTAAGTHRAFCNSRKFDHDAYKAFIRARNGQKWWEAPITDADIAAYMATSPATN